MITKQMVLLLAVFMMGCDKKSNGGPDAAVEASISDVTVKEGNSGNTTAEVSISLNKPPSKTVTLNLSTMEGTAKSGEDFVALSNVTITLAPNEVSKKVALTIVGDSEREGDETFSVIISGNGVRVQKNIATITIENDDTGVPVPGGYDAPTSYPGYTLAWADEFNGTTLDRNAWSFENGDGCPNLCGWGNNELEYYTDRPENLYFQDGKLVIEARKETFNGKNYTSSKILTRGKKTFKYGRIDIRARLPKGKGIWPAFWLLPQNGVYGGWPRSGEIDLMELVGHEPNKVYGTLHFGPGPGSTQISRSYTLPSGDFSNEFHVFSVEWKQDQIKWYVDGNLFSTANKADFGANNYPFNEEFFLIFNLAVGGNWPGNPDATTTFPQWLVVDYVRVYQ